MGGHLHSYSCQLHRGGVKRITSYTTVSCFVAMRNLLLIKLCQLVLFYNSCETASLPGDMRMDLGEITLTRSWIAQRKREGQKKRGGYRCRGRHRLWHHHSWFTTFTVQFLRHVHLSHMGTQTMDIFAPQPLLNTPTHPHTQTHTQNPAPGNRTNSLISNPPLLALQRALFSLVWFFFTPFCLTYLERNTSPPPNSYLSTWLNDEWC